MTVYLIDGYNVLHQLVGRPAGRDPGHSTQVAPAWQPPEAGSSSREASALPEGAPDTAQSRSLADLDDQRRRLIDRIASFIGATSDTAIIVFDSHSQALQKSESATARVQVYFGSFSESADAIIERETYARSAGENVIVVSSDYNLQKTVFKANVTRRSSRQFVLELQEHTRKVANASNCITMSHRVEERVGPETLERLKALREALEGGKPGPGR